MSDEPSNPDWLLERISNLNGQVVASHMMNAILFYTLRTGAPVESIYLGQSSTPRPPGRFALPSSEYTCD